VKYSRLVGESEGTETVDSGDGMGRCALLTISEGLSR
jgi:hypothetical protein